MRHKIGQQDRIRKIEIRKIEFRLYSVKESQSQSSKQKHIADFFACCEYSHFGVFLDLNDNFDNNNNL